MARVVVIGAGSAIAQATARLLAAAGDHLLVAARNPQRLASLALDLRARGAAQVDEVAFDAATGTDYEAFADAVWSPGVDLLLLAHGSLPPQEEVEDDVLATRCEFETNALAGISLLAAFAPRFERQGHGRIVVIGSVAGDRGRRSNYVYGSAKAAIGTYCQGLEGRLAGSGVQVLTVKPGLVDSPMTAHLRKGLLWAQPEQIARGIVRALDRGPGVVYLPWFWRYIMLLVRLIPQRWFRKLGNL